jgi:hypothetical protein
MGSERPHSTHRPAKKARPTKRQIKASTTPAEIAGETEHRPRHIAVCRDLRPRLNLIHAVAITVAIALEKENAEHEGDFAAVLTRCVADPLWEVIIDHLGGEDSQA